MNGELVSCLLAIASVLVVHLASGEQCPSDGSCPDLSSHEIDLTPLQGSWDTLYYDNAQGSLVDDIPRFFNLSLCGSLQNSPCGANSSTCYSPELAVFHNLGNTSSCQYSYADRHVTFMYQFSSEDGVSRDYGSGNVTVTLICGRTLGVPEVTLGDPHSHEIAIIWETSAACKNSSSLHYTEETKCYHIHTYEDNGLKANFIDLTSLIKPTGYEVISIGEHNFKILLSVCKPMLFPTSDTDHAGCNGTMGCLIEGGSGIDGVSVPSVLGEWSNSGAARLHMKGDLLTMEYGTTVPQGVCGPARNLTVQFLCPAQDENLGPHIIFSDSHACLTIVNWYTAFACGRAAIQASGCYLKTLNGLVFDLTSLGLSVMHTNSSTQVDVHGDQYVYSLQICQGHAISTDCSLPLLSDTRVIQQEDGLLCRSLGRGSGSLRYADGTLTLTYTGGDTCHSNFARTSSITFLCPENLDNERSNTSAVTFLGEEDCFYGFEWVTDLACGSKTSGISDCQFELPGGGGGTYNFAPLVGTEDQSWVAVSSEVGIACFMINPCGELTVTETTHANGVDYCNHRHAPAECAGVSVCRIDTDGSAVPIGTFDLGDPTKIVSADNNVLSVLGELEGSNNTAIIHYVCKTGDLYSAPVYVGVTNQFDYQFHWSTFAACPSGMQSGSECTVSYQGYQFNLSSIPVLSFHSGDYVYEISVCSAIQSNMTRCNDGDSRGAAICQVQGSQHFKLGEANSTLIYEDGTLKLHYNKGQACHNSTARNTTVLFICDSSAKTASVSSVTEDHCQYVVEVRTELACPPSSRATECVYFNGTKFYDFSGLSRSLDQGNWEAEDGRGSIFFINICQPLNHVPGCSPLAGACKKESHDGHMTYSTIGIASDANFSTVQYDSEGDHILLRYRYRVSPGDCPYIETDIEFICNINASKEEGPRYASGGDRNHPCKFLFTWHTVGACPIEKHTSTTCQLLIPSGFTFDLSSLRSPSNDEKPYVITSEASSFGFSLAACGTLPNISCNSQSGVAVCQTDSKNKTHICGLSSTQKLVYFDGSLSLHYEGGDICKHNQMHRSVVINLECDRTINMSQSLPRYLNESDCAYSFEWATPLACEPKELQCVAAGGKYDLTPLLGSQHWVVDTGAVGGDYVYVIGGCRSLDYSSLPRCPQIPWMGACRYPSGDSSGAGVALGYVVGDIEEESEGSLRLEYHNGETCQGGQKSMVHILFTCGGLQSGPGVPKLAIGSDSCHTHINWVTQYACSRNAISSSTWVLEDPVSSTIYNFTNLDAAVSRIHTIVNEDGIATTYNYTVSLHGGSIACPSSSSPSPQGILFPGACQVRTSGGCNISNPSCVHTLGVFQANNNSLSLIDGEVRAEYDNGDLCHHAPVARKSIILFECDHREKTFLEVMPESSQCEYTFVVRTSLACVADTPIGVECQVEGFHDLVSFQRMPYHSVASEGKLVYLSVCSTLGSGVGGCEPGSASCLNDGSNVYINLGVPSARYPPKALGDNSGIILHYIEGDICNSTTGVRWNTTLLLLCNRNVHMGTPEFVNSINCQYTIKWESISACHNDIPSSPSSKTACSLIDSYTNSQVLDFHTFIRDMTLVASDNNGGKYYVQLCGTSSPSPPKGCDQTNTGICHMTSDGSYSTMVYANHTFSLVSHSPRVVDVVFHSGRTCESNQNRNWTASVQMICSNQSETLLPVLSSDEDCELGFVWRNQSFCAGEGASGGCMALDASNNYVYSLDGLLAQNWDGLVSPESSSSTPTQGQGGTFTFGICRNLNPFSSSGIHCSTPSAVCWHTSDQRHINLGRSSSRPEVVVHSSQTSIHIEYDNGDVCNTTSGQRFHTDLYIHCTTTTESTPILSPHDDGAINNNCSWIVSMNSPFACKHNLSTTTCEIATGAGRFNFTDMTSAPLTFHVGADDYSICLCGSSPSCKHSGITRRTGSSSVNLGVFNFLSVSTSTGGPKFAYYKGDSCDGGSAKYQSWLFMECNRTALGQGNFKILESASSDCVKIFVWHTNRACLSEQVSCSITIPSKNSNLFYDFSPLHSHIRPWKLHVDSETYYINICGEIVNIYADQIASCGGDAAICVKPDGNDGNAYAIGTASTQQFYYDNTNVVLKFTGPPSDKCRDSSPHVQITMNCGVSGLTIQEKNICDYKFTWNTPYACKESTGPEVFMECQAVMKASSDFEFYPFKIAKDSEYIYHGARGIYHVNICRSSSTCGEGIAVCLGGINKHINIASFKDQSIMVDGYQMLIHMNNAEGTTHAIVRVVCVLDSTQDVDTVTKPLRLDNVAQTGDHEYYYFTLYTQLGEGCNFSAATVGPSSTSPTNSGGGATKVKGNSGVAIAVIVITLAVMVAVLVVIFYKKSRRERARNAILHLIIGKSSEPVRYHKVSVREDEQSLMADYSESDESEDLVEGDKGGSRGGRGRGDNNDENSDEELINL